MKKAREKIREAIIKKTGKDPQDNFTILRFEKKNKNFIYLVTVLWSKEREETFYVKYAKR